MKEYHFHNVEITIAAASGKEAYRKLCTALATLLPDVEYTTNTYSIENEENERSTEELFLNQ